MILLLTGFLAVAWGYPVEAGMNLLSDDQLDTADAGGLGSLDVWQKNEGDFKTKIDQDNVKALNVVNIVKNKQTNTVTDDDSVNILVIKDAAQLNVRAVNIINTIGGSIGTGLNVHANRGSVQFLNQSNVNISE